MSNKNSRSALMVSLALKQRVLRECPQDENVEQVSVSDELSQQTTDFQNKCMDNHEIETFTQNQINGTTPNTLQESITESDPFEASDDSDADPHYIPDSNQSEDDDDDEDINMMAQEVEANLEAEASETVLIDQMATSSVLSSNRTQKPSSSKAYLEEIKLKRNTGQPYVSVSGRSIVAKECKPLKNCRKQCHLKITFIEQKQIFDQYWGLKSYNLRCAFLSGLVEVRNKISQTLQKKSTKNRNYSCYYFIEIGIRKVSVCKNCFKTILGESDGILRTIASKKSQSPGSTITSDKRGTRVPSNSTSEEKTTEIKNHINSFPSYESHYTRRDTSQRYFHSSLSITTMFRLYTEKVETPVSITKFSQVFRTMGIKFKSPKTDTCHKCDILAAKLPLVESESQKQELIAEQQIHHDAADEAYKSKQRDKLLAANNTSEVKTFAFDLQQCLPTPNVMTSVSFYKRLLWTYNLTVHDCFTSASYCYMWNEVIGQRGGNEIASCLLAHLKTLPNTVKQAIFYSDCCPGQNKNSFVGTMFYSFMQENTHSNLEYIDHKFLVPGHSHMECDSDHAAIERKKKRTSVKIHEPRDWYQFVRSVSNRFTVQEIGQNDIFDFAAVAKSKLMWRKVNTNGEKFAWHDVKWIRYTKDRGHLFYKTSYKEEEPFQLLNINRRGFNNVGLQDVSVCYKNPLKVSEGKKRDLMDLLPLLDPSVHDFYINLNTEPQLDVHPDITEEDNE